MIHVYMPSGQQPSHGITKLTIFPVMFIIEYLFEVGYKGINLP